MKQKPWGRAKELFSDALELPETERAPFLDAQCAGDAVLRAQVERLLAAHEAPDGPLQDSNPALKALTAKRAAPRTFQPGDEAAGRFRIRRFLGCGGMGEVYEAEDLELGGAVALKTLRPEYVADERLIARFRREVQIARRATHPNVCRVFDAGRHRSEEGRDVAFLTMELLEGETLAQRLKRQGAISPEEALPLIRQMADGLDALHQNEIVHRDFKPSNVMLIRSATGGERAVITDFGLARKLSSETGIDTAVSNTGQILGTPDYMAPEQLTGKPVTPSTDVYALGLTLYEMLTGEKPFREGEPIEKAVQRITEAPTPPKTKAPALPRAWSDVVLACLEKEPQDRPEDVRAVAEALEETAGTRIPVLRRSSGSRRALGPLGRGSRTYHAAVAVAFAAVLALWAGAMRVGESEGARSGEDAEFGRRLEQGDDARARRDLRTAIEHYRAAARADPTSFVAEARLGDSLMEAEERSEALAHLQKALALCPPVESADVAGLRVRGQAALDLWELAEAEGAFSAWLAREPDAALPRLFRADVRSDRGELAEGINDLRVGCALLTCEEPDKRVRLADRAVGMQIVFFLRFHHAFPEAGTELTRLVGVLGEYPARRSSASIYRALHAALTGHHDEALALIERERNTSEEYWADRIDYLRAHVLADAGRTVEAIESLRTGERRVALRSGLRRDYALGAVYLDYFADGRIDDIDPLKELTEESGLGPWEFYRIGTLAATAGRVDVARRLLERIEPLQATRSRLSKEALAAEIASANGQGGAALLTGYEARAREYPFLQLVTALAAAYERLGQTRRARDVWSVIADRPGNVWHEPMAAPPGILRFARSRKEELEEVRH